MISRFFSRQIRHLKEGFFGVLRHGAMAISSASAVTITLFIVAIFLIFSANINNITQEVEDGVEISVLISFDHEEQSQMDTIENQIKAISGVESVKYSSKEDELKYYLESMNDDDVMEIFAGYGDDNPMHNAFYVKVKDGNMIASIADQIKVLEGVDSVNYGGNSAMTLVTTLESIRLGGFILVFSLTCLAIFLISNTIKLTIYARHKEIGIMRNVGATNGYIRAPFMIEGMIIGFMGSIIPVLVAVFGYIYLYDFLGGVFLSEIFVMIEPHPFILYVAGILAIIGIVVGLIGSFLSVSKYLRWKR